MNLHLPRTIKALQFRFKGQSIVYALRCHANNMMYVGSTFTPMRRFYQHLVTGEKSNNVLQLDIHKYGLENFTAYVLEVFDVPKHLNKLDRIKYLQNVKQLYIDAIPKTQLYNYNNAIKQHN